MGRGSSGGKYPWDDTAPVSDAAEKVNRLLVCKNRKLELNVSKTIVIWCSTSEEYDPLGGKK